MTRSPCKPKGVAGRPLHVQNYFTHKFYWVDNRNNFLYSEGNQDSRSNALEDTNQLPDLEINIPIRLKFDKRKEGWTLLYNVPLGSGKQTLRLEPIRQVGENQVYLVVHQAICGNSSGQEDAEYLLENLEIIPAEWKKLPAVAFPGTEWKDPEHGDRALVPFLSFKEEICKMAWATYLELLNMKASFVRFEGKLPNWMKKIVVNTLL